MPATARADMIGTHDDGDDDYGDNDVTPRRSTS
jgi:hypothetical protein